MDRTREFLSLAASTNVLQKPQSRSEDPSFIRAEAIQLDLDLLEQAISQNNRVDKELIDRIENSLAVLFEQQSEMNITTEIDECISKAIKRKHTVFMLRLTTLLNKHREQVKRQAVELQIQQEDQERSRPRVHRGSGMQQSAQYAQREIEREEISSIRRREFESLEQHINELGRMVTEVSMHISLQGEKVEMIDDLFTKTKSNLRGSSYELRGALEQVKMKRRTILLIFAVLFGILLIKYLRWI